MNYYSYLLLFLLLCGAVQGQTRVYDHCGCTEELSADGVYTLDCNGVLMEEGRYKNGVRNGAWTSRNRKGKIIITANYQNDLLHGSYEQFYFNGKPKLEARFEEGLPVGVWTYYNQQGKVCKQGEYRNGAAMGEWKIWDKRGKKVVVKHDFNDTNAVPTDEYIRYFEKNGLMRDGQSAEWLVLYFPPYRDPDTELFPMSGWVLSGDFFAELVNIPPMYLNTYVRKEYAVEVEVRNGALKVLDGGLIEMPEEFDPKVASFPFAVQTNNPKKVVDVEMSAASERLLKDRLRDVLALSGPWITKGVQGKEELHVQFILNEMNRVQAAVVDSTGLDEQQ